MTTDISSRPIVVGVDGSASALHAAHWAADEAARAHAPLRLVHAVSVSSAAWTGGFGPAQEFFDALEADGRTLLADTETTIRQAHPRLDVRINGDMRIADPVPTLVEASEDARLVVLGSRGLGGFTGMLAGSTAVALAAHAHCPVAVIRGREPDGLPPSRGPVVVGVDGSPASESALAMAFDEASARATELVAVHTWIEFASESAYGYARQFTHDWDAIETGEREVLAERMAGRQEKYPDVTVRRVVTREQPVPCLLGHAADAQLLVVGSRGRGGITGMLLGSVSHALIHHATCPLLIVRPTAAD